MPQASALPVVVAPATDASEWDAFVADHPDGTIDHLWAWRHVIASALGHESAYLEARRGGVLVGVLPLVLVRSTLFGRSVVSMPFLNYGGILADDPDTVNALVDAARDVAIRFGASHVELRHSSRLCPSLPCRQHKLSMTLALPGDVEALWAMLDRKVRNQVRKAQKANLEVVSGGRELVDDFYGVFARNMRDLGTPVYPKSLFTATIDALAGSARVFVVRHETGPIAAGVSIGFRQVVLNPWASSLREFRQLCPNMLLYWSMLEWAVAAGATTFDFGRSSPGGGTHQFKLQWGAVERALCWEYVLLSRSEPPVQDPSNAKFGRAIAIWQRLPLGIANRIGPIIARSLP
jgi:FemAB-related protein (PEP-CTERM system-associated)